MKVTQYYSSRPVIVLRHTAFSCLHEANFEISWIILHVLSVEYFGTSLKKYVKSKEWVAVIKLQDNFTYPDTGYVDHQLSGSG